MITDNQKNYFLLIIILVATIITFYPSLQNDFTNWDDNVYVTENHLVQELSILHVKTIFTSFLSGNYHPLTLLTYSLEYFMFGKKAFGYHAFSLGLHLINCLLVFWFILLLTNNRFIPFFVCLLFAVHPVKVESVAWIADQKDLLSSLFLLAMLVAYVHYSKRKRAVTVLLSLFFFILSFLAKANGLFYPLILLLIDYYSNGKVTFANIREKIPYFVVSAFFGVIALIARQSYQAKLMESLFSGLDTVFLGVHRLIFYFLFRTLLPVNQSLLYPHPHKLFPPAAYIVAAICILILLLAVIFLLRKRNPVVPFGILFFLMGIAPALTVVIIGHSADRFTYLPSIGIYFILAYGISACLEKCISRHQVRRITVVLLCLTVAVISGVVSWQRCSHWRDGIAVWSRAISRHQQFGLAYFNRGESYYQRGQLNKAVVDYSRAIELDPDYYEIYYRRGLAYQRTRQYERAIADFDAAIQRRQDYYYAYVYRGVAYSSLGQIERAIADYSRAIQIQPDLPDAYHNRGLAYYNTRRTRGACTDLIKACQLGTCNYLQLLQSRGLCRVRQ